jgi:hypothetical protein
MPVVRIMYVVICLRLFVFHREKMRRERKKIDLDAELKGTRTAGAVICGDKTYVQSPALRMRKVPASIHKLSARRPNARILTGSAARCARAQNVGLGAAA